MAGYPSNLAKKFPPTQQFPQHILPLLPLYNAQWWGYESLTAIVLVVISFTRCIVSIDTSLIGVNQNSNLASQSLQVCGKNTSFFPFSKFSWKLLILMNISKYGSKSKMNWFPVIVLYIKITVPAKKSTCKPHVRSRGYKRKIVIIIMVPDFYALKLHMEPITQWQHNVFIKW